MVGVRRLGKVRHVTAGTGRGRSGVLASDVTISAREFGVQARQRELGVLAVIKGRIRPVRGGVADRAIRRERRLHVVGIAGCLKLREVAPRAIGRELFEVTTHVTTLAFHAGVSTGKRELRFAVIESRIQPICRRVAHPTVLRESRLHMVRIRGCVVLLRMAGKAIGGCSLELPVQVATGAVEPGMHASQREASELEVIELGPKPAVHGMAVIARQRER